MIAPLVLLLISLATENPTAAPFGVAQGTGTELTGPKNAVESLARAYRARSIDQYAALLTADYRFHSVNAARPAQYVGGIDREFEITSARAMFTGGVNHAGRASMPPADSITVGIGALEESPDPEHPDSIQSYRVVSARPFHLHVYVAKTKGFDVSNGLEIFYLVRGDAALRAPGQSVDAKTWYIRRWLDDTSGLATTLAQTEGTCDEQPSGKSLPDRSPPDAPDSAASKSGGGMHAPLMLAIHPLGNPACPALDISCDIPGTENARVEVFDVMGRLCAHKDLAAPQPGTHVIAVGEGAELHPGAYWVRLTQGKRVPSTRMVVVAQ